MHTAAREILAGGLAKVGNRTYAPTGDPADLREGRMDTHKTKGNGFEMRERGLEPDALRHRIQSSSRQESMLVDVANTLTFKTFSLVRSNAERQDRHTSTSMTATVQPQSAPALGWRSSRLME